MRVAILIALASLGLAAVPRTTSADKIDDQVTTLQSDEELEVRAKAALRLGYLGKKADADDVRAVAALTFALQIDTSPLVRAAAAGALGKAVIGTTPEYERKNAIAALARAIKADPTTLVRRRAQRSFDRINAEP